MSDASGGEAGGGAAALSAGADGAGLDMPDVLAAVEGAAEHKVVDVAEEVAGAASGGYAWQQVAPDCNIGPEQVAYTVSQVQKADVVLEPYPHVQVYDIFTPALYACMMQQVGLRNRLL